MKISTSPKKTADKYPFVGEGLGYIVLFTSKMTGVCLAGPVKADIGKVHGMWSEDAYTKVEGPLYIHYD